MSVQMTPFEKLQNLAQRSVALALGLPEQTVAQETLQGIGFALAGHAFVAQMGQVTEILDVPVLTRIPRVESWVLGLANVRGRLVPVIDVADLLGVESSVPLRQRRMLVVEHDDHPTGLIVDAVLGMQQLPHAAWQETTELLPDALSALTDGSYVFQSKQWNLLQFNRLIQSERFSAVAIGQSANKAIGLES
ncbi:chemotaxis protein CheW [Salinibius halmophilus]|uniref:chemotaxis protein CheW n=1 Tax=Salinibius halmophilus TaxID=1853216 RepID=UPI000E66B96B|nr:chemotaxis protein CheW [Salinibius halmophilus]